MDWIVSLRRTGTLVSTAPAPVSTLGIETIERCCSSAWTVQGEDRRIEAARKNADPPEAARLRGL